MKMSALSRWFVNRPGRGARAVAQVARCLERIDAPAPRSALELGCGGGAVARHLAERGMAVVATDLDIRELRVARGRRPPEASLHLAVMDAERLGLAGERFDLVVAQHMLHHVPDWPAAIGEAARVLRPGGHLVWIDFALPPFLARLLARLARHGGLYTLAQVRAAFAGAGLTERLHERPFPFGLHRMVLRKAPDRPDGAIGRGDWKVPGPADLLRWVEGVE
jgi:ubiquinone/menaquinone biosynthesis C-methylase UbiE